MKIEQHHIDQMFIVGAEVDWEDGSNQPVPRVAFNRGNEHRGMMEDETLPA